MSWEEFNDEKPCPCGKGKYTITRQENDWGKSHVSFRMNCKDCRNTYVQFVFRYHDPGAPGGTSSSDLWVLKEDKQALDDLEKQIGRKKEAILSMAQVRYLQRWLESFVDKPKKRIWAELKSIDRTGGLIVGIGAIGASIFFALIFGIWITSIAADVSLPRLP